MSEAGYGALTEGTLLGGRVRYAQFEGAYRTGIEPVLLAACVPAAPGETVLEAGTGAGAGLLCLAARVPGLQGLGLERDPAQAALAAANFAANGHDGLRAAAVDLLGWTPDAAYDHAFANPPWHEPEATPSPHAARDAAKRAAPGLLAAWAAALAGALRPRGTLSLIIPAAQLAAGTAALQAAKCGGITLVPLWPRAGEPAKLVILRGVRLGRGPAAVLPGLALHGAEGYTEETENLLRQAVALALPK